MRRARHRAAGKVCGKPGKPGGTRPAPGLACPSAAVSPMGKSGLKHQPAPAELRQRFWGQGEWWGARDPAPHSPQPRRLGRVALGTSRCSLTDEPEALPKSSSQGKQLLGRNLRRAELDGRNSFCLWLYSCSAKSQPGLGGKSRMQMLGAGRVVLCLETPLAKGSAAGSVCPSARVPVGPQIPGTASGQSKAAKGLGCTLSPPPPRPHPGWAQFPVEANPRPVQNES